MKLGARIWVMHAHGHRVLFPLHWTYEYGTHSEERTGAASRSPKHHGVPTRAAPGDSGSARRPDVAHPEAGERGGVDGLLRAGAALRRPCLLRDGHDRKTQ